jgi:hypothetical protein
MNTPGGISRLDLTHLLYQALGEPIGLVLQVSDPSRVRQRLYAARTAAQDPDLAGLQIRQWIPDAEGRGNLVIVKSRVINTGQVNEQ